MKDYSKQHRAAAARAAHSRKKGKAGQAGGFTEPSGDDNLLTAEGLRQAPIPIGEDENQPQTGETRLLQENLDSIKADTINMSESECDMSDRFKQRIQVGTDIHGNPVVQWFTGTSVQDVVNKALKVILDNQPPSQSGRRVNEPGFITYVEDWFRLYKEPSLRHTTQTAYRNLLERHIYPYFERRSFSEITPSVIQDFYNRHRDLSKSTVHQMAVILHQVFDLAIEDGLMSTNPTESKRLVLPTGKHNRNALSDAQVHGIIRGLPKLGLQDRLLVAIPLFTGMRRGEMLGLRWEDIDREKNRIHIARSVTFLNNQPVIGPTKSNAGDRFVPLDAALAAILDLEPKESGFVIGDGFMPVTEKTFQRAWQRIGKSIDLYGATPHILRHTYITLAVSSGADVKSVQYIAGHSDIRITLDKYTHVREEKIREAGEQICRVFNTI